MTLKRCPRQYPAARHFECQNELYRLRDCDEVGQHSRARASPYVGFATTLGALRLEQVTCIELAHVCYCASALSGICIGLSQPVEVMPDNCRHATTHARLQSVTVSTSR